MDFLQYIKGGMHKDNEISAQPKDSYRDANNGYLFSGEGNFFSFTTAKGNKLSFEVPISSYIGQSLFPDALLERIIIGWVEGTDGIFLFTTTNEKDGGFGEILKVTFSEESSLGTVSVIYQNGLFNFTTKHPIGNEVVYIEESDTIGRLYWTDNHNPPRCINVFNPPDPAFPQLIDTLNLTPGFKGSEVEFGGTIKDAEQVPINGNLNCGMYRYAYRLTNIGGGAQTNWSILSNPTFIGPNATGDGSSSNFIYYVKFEGDNKDKTTTKGIKIVINDVDTLYDQIEVAAFYYNGIDSNPNGTIITIGTVPQILPFEYIHTGSENLGTVTPGELEITSANIEKAKTIATNKNRLMFGNITERAELNLKPIVSNIKSETFPYTYASNGSGFADIVDDANNQWQTIHSAGWNSGVTSTLSTSPSPKGIFGHAAAQAYGLTGITSGDILFGQWYGVHRSSSTTINYPIGSPDYYSNDPGTGLPKFFKGKRETEYDITVGTSGSPVKAFIRIKKFKSQDSTIGDVYQNEMIPDEFLDSKGTFNSFYTQGYWRGETYRFGLVVWDKNMTPTFVQWIEDKKMPEQYDNLDVADFTNSSSARLMTIDQNSSTKAGRNNAKQMLRNLGIRFNNIDLSSIATDLGIAEADLPSHISGFSIVRAPRDEQILAQGLLLPVAFPGNQVVSTSQYYNNYFPFNWEMTNGGSSFFGNATQGQYINPTTKKYGKFVSPDQLFNYKGRFDQGPADNAYASEIDITNIKVLGSMGTGYRDRVTTIMITRTDWATDGKTDTDTAKGYARYLDRFDFKNGDEIPVYSIRSFSSGSSDYIFDPKYQTRKFHNMIYWNKTISGLNQDTDNTYSKGGSAGAIICAEDEFPNLISSNPSYVNNRKQRYCLSVNLVNKKTPYGGTSEAAKGNTNYIATGHFQPITDAVYTENGNSWKFDEVEVFGGDCHLSLFDVTTETLNTSSHHGTYGRTDMRSYTDVFAVESNINVGLREGRHANQDGIMTGRLINHAVPNGTWVSAPDPPVIGVGQQNPNGVAFQYPEAFVYNEAYSELDGNVFYPAAPLNFNAKEKFINRVRYSLPKISNEPIDNFRQFLIDNFKDVDIQNRAINNLRVRGENLYYWQDRAVGYLPINERITVPTALGEPTQIGVGGVMTRYDERTDFYGNQHKHGLIETPPGFIWIDRQNKALISMSLGGEIAELSAMKGMMSFLGPLIKRTTLDNPIDKTTNGVLGVYDARTKNTYISFVGTKSGTLKGTIILIGNGQTLFNVGVITPSHPFYDIITGQVAGNAITVTINGTTYETTLVGGIGIFLSGPDWSLVINTEISGTVIGDDAEFIIYISMEAETVAINQLDGNFISRYSFHPSIYMRYNELMFSIPTTAQGTRKDVYVHDEGDLAKFYDKVHDTDITCIVNPNIELPKVFDNIEMNIGKNGPSSVEYNTSFQTGTDLDIPNNNEYRFRNRDWVGSVARDASVSGPNGRMRDHYMEVKLIKDNKLNNNSTVSSNEEIKLLSLKTIFRPTY